MPNFAQITGAIFIAASAFFLGYSSKTEVPRDRLGDEVRRIATEKGGDTALVIGKRDGVNAVHIPSEKPIPPCDKRTGNQEICKFDVRKDPHGKYVLFHKGGTPVPDSEIFAEIITWVHKGSFCTTSSSGGKTTTNCCHTSYCW